MAVGRKLSAAAFFKCAYRVLSAGMETKHRYSFLLTVEAAQSRLALLRDGAEVAIDEWVEGRDMGRRLFMAIETLLAKEGLKPTEVAKFRVDSRIPEVYTSSRIAETVANVYTFGRERLQA